MESTAKRGKVSKAKTAKGCKNKWQSMNKETMHFLSCDILASHTVRRSGATAAEFRADALEYYIKRHRGEFKFQTVYDYLKDKPKWLRDCAQQKRDASKRKARSTPAKHQDDMRMSDSEEEQVGPKVPGQKKARRLEKDLVVLTAAAVVAEANVAADIAKFQERSKINLLAIEVEQMRLTLDQERKDDDIIGLDLTGLPEWKVQYYEERIT